jgi:FkbM family methyltransferase
MTKSKIKWSSVPAKVKWVLELELKSYFTPFCGPTYAFNKWVSVLFNKKTISFMGVDFHYQDRLNPFSIFQYVNEVKETIDLFHLDKLNHSVRILEIGGNIGNWGIVLCHYLPNATLYTFEPNPEPYKLLEKNSSQFPLWKIFNLGVGPNNDKINFYVVPNKSGQGSIYKDNANKNLLSNEAVEETQISVVKLDTNFIAKNFQSNHFDFIKIDIEGAEWEAIYGLKDLTWDGMYVELSLDQPNRDTVEKFMHICQSIWPNVKLCKLIQNSPEVADLFLINKK